MARLNGFEDLRMREEDALGAARLLHAVENELAALGDADALALERAKAELRPLKIPENADGVLAPRRDLPHALVQLAGQFMAGVAHVDPEHVDSGVKQLLQHLRGFGCRPDCRDHCPVSPCFSGSDNLMVHCLEPPVSTSIKPSL